MLMLLLSMAIAGLPAAPRLQPSLDVSTPQYEAGCYPSGLMVIGVSRPDTGQATTVWLSSQGKSADPVGQGGAVHLIEHLFYRSTPQRGPEFMDATHGLQIAAQTRNDTVVFSATAAVEDLERLVGLHGWVFAAPLFGVTEDVFEAEREVVKHEAWYRGAHSGRAAIRTLDHALFPASHAYRNSLPAPEELDNITLESLEGLATEVLSPEGATLYVEADLPTSQILDQIDGALPGQLKAGTGVPCNSPGQLEVPEGVSTTDVQRLEGARWRAALYVGWTLPPQPGRKEAALQLATENLEWVVRRELEMVPGLKQWSQHYYVSCQHRTGRLAWVEMCTVDLPPDVDPELALKAIRRGLPEQSARRRDVDTSLEARALYTRWLESQESQSNDHIIDRALYAHQTGAADLFTARLVGISQTSHDAVTEIGAKWFTAERMAAAHVRPGVGPVHDTRRISGEAVLAVPDSTPWAAPLGLTELDDLYLKNGLRFWVLDRANAPVAYTQLVFPAGWMREPVPGTNTVLETMSVFRMPVSFRDLRGDIGQTSRATYGTWTNGFETSGTAGNLDAGLWTVRAMTEGLTYDLSGRQPRLDQSVEASFSWIQDLPWTLAPAIANERLLGDHRAAMSWWDRNKAARYVREEVLRGWHKSVYRPEHATLIVVADRPLAESTDLATKYLATFKGRGKAPLPLRSPEPPPAPPARTALALEIESVLNAVELSCRIDGLGPDSFAAVKVLQTAARRATYHSLRTSGGTYTPWARVDVRTTDLSVFRMGAEVSDQDTGPAAQALLAVSEALASGAHPDFIDAAARAAQARWSRRFGSATGTRDALEAGAAWGLSTEQMLGMREAIGQVDAEDVAGVLQDCVGHEVVTAVGRNAFVRLTEAGLSPESVDWRRIGAEVVDSLE